MACADRAHAGRHNIRELDTIEQMTLVAGGLIGRFLSYEDLIEPNGLASSIAQSLSFNSLTGRGVDFGGVPHSAVVRLLGAVAAGLFKVATPRLHYPKIKLTGQADHLLPTDKVGKRGNPAPSIP